MRDVQASDIFCERLSEDNLVGQTHGSRIKIVDLVKTFDEVVAVDKVSMNIDPGTFLTILGPSGSGKTTILKIIAGFEKPTSGEVFIDDHAMVNRPSYKRNIGMVFQNYALFPHKTVYENIAFPLRMRKMKVSEIREKVKYVTELVELSGYETRYPGQLSGGQQQRVALARCLVYSPSVLLMDEPLGALDKKLREHMQLELKKIHNKLKTTIIYVTHDQSEGLNMSDLILVLDKGKIMQLGKPSEVYENPANYFVADFMGESNFIDGSVIRSEDSLVVIDADLGVQLKGRSEIQHVEAGQSVRMVIRPEKIILEAGQCENRLQGVIREVVYLGDIVKYYVNVQDMKDLYVKVHSHYGVKVFQPGEIVTLGWSAKDCKLIG